MQDPAAIHHPPFTSAADRLFDEFLHLLRGRRVGLLTHPAALCGDGRWCADRFFDEPHVELACVLGPEHGVFGQGGAGERVETSTHPRWGVPLYSLYGEERKPTPDMLRGLDVLVIDLQDLGVRCYTYGATLALALEAAAEQNLPVIVVDRPIPFAGIADGPLLDPAFQSFVGHLRAPFVYGLSQGSTARWLQSTSVPGLDLAVIEPDGYHGELRRGAAWPAWVPPSTGIRSWESAWCYPATVFSEALPALDCGRGGPIPFQVLGAPGIDGAALADAMNDLRLPGVRFYPHALTPPRDGDTPWREGVRLHVADPAVFRPVRTGITLLAAIQDRSGVDELWGAPGARPDFFDLLCGTDAVRRALQDGVPADDIAKAWDEDLAAWRRVCAVPS